MTESNGYGHYDILFIDEDEPQKERFVEQLSLVTEAEARKCAVGWQKNTWVAGRIFTYRKATTPTVV